jgi:hypothetical protein
MMEDVSNYNLTGAKLNYDDSRRSLLGLEVPGLLEKRPSVVIGDKVSISSFFSFS